MGARIGDAAVFGFDHSTVFEMRIEQLTPPTSCVGSAPAAPRPIGSARRRFALEPQADGEVL